MRSFDQSRNIRNRRAPIIRELHHADHRMQSREGIRRDLRMRRRDSPEQSRFSRVRITDQSGVRDRAQLEQESSFFAFFAFGVLRAARDCVSF